LKVIAARGLDRALHRLGARIGEEHRVGEGVVDQPLRQLLALRAAVEVGDVHQRLGLLLDRLDQVRMAMPQRVDRDTGGEIEEATAVLGNQIHALASHRTHIAPWVNGHECGDGHRTCS
jgi:hypothetical protein